MGEFHRHADRASNHEREEADEDRERNSKRICDFCGESTAILFCRADSAKLCFACDREVHSTNQLFTKHVRSQLCDVCDSSPASILCSTENLVLCQNCDWETHNQLISTVHNRRPLEGFNGCPTVCELCTIVGFEEMGKKDLIFSEESGADLDGSGDYGFSDLLVWDTPSIFSLDDLIGSTDDEHGFRAMGVPPLPKNRNAACGRHKEEIFRQLRKMAMLEGDLNFDHIDVKPEPVLNFQSIAPNHSSQSKDTYIGHENDADTFVFPSYEASAFHLCSDYGEGTNQLTGSTFVSSYNEESCLVPDQKSEKINHGHEIQETVPFFHRVPMREFSSQNRDTALSRYKEKKKTRRYDQHIRYESRKARAESRTRIKGRFAKIIDHQ